MTHEVVGQDRGVRFLDRIRTGHFTSPLLLIGDEGVGRRTAVRAMARQMFCEDEGALSCKCYSCKQMHDDNHVDFHMIAPEAEKDLGIEPVRGLIEEASSYPLMGKVKILLVDGADRLTTPAANALLKTLEEPPSRVRFVLLAENYSKVIPTIQSRCGRVAFERLPEAFIHSRLSTFESDTTKALVYARMAEGSVGRAIRYWGSTRIVFRDRLITLLTAAANKDFTSVFSTVSNFEKELQLGLKILNQLVHDLLIIHLDTALMIHLDAQSVLFELRKKIPDSVCQKLSTGLRAIQSKLGRINAPFHLSTLLVTAFEV